MNIEPEDAEVLWMATLLGEQELALQLYRLGFSSEDEALEDAEALIPEILEAVEEALKRGSSS